MKVSLLFLVGAASAALLSAAGGRAGAPRSLFDELPTFDQLETLAGVSGSGLEDSEAAASTFQPLQALDLADIRDLTLLIKSKNRRLFNQVRGLSVHEFRKTLSENWEPIMASLKFRNGVTPRQLNLLGKAAGALGLDGKKKMEEAKEKIKRAKLGLRNAKLVLDKNMREFYLNIINLKDAVRNLEEYSNVKYEGLNNWVSGLTGSGNTPQLQPKEVKARELRPKPVQKPDALAMAANFGNSDSFVAPPPNYDAGHENGAAGGQVLTPQPLANNPAAGQGGSIMTPQVGGAQQSNLAAAANQPQAVQTPQLTQQPAGEQPQPIGNAQTEPIIAKTEGAGSGRNRRLRKRHSKRRY